MSALAQGTRPAFGLPGRIQDANSNPRSIAVVGLGHGGAGIARGLPGEAIAHLDVHVLAKHAAGPDAVAAIKAGGGDLQRDLAGADMIFLVACRGDDVGLAPVVATIARSGKHPVTGLYIVPSEEIAGDDETLKTLRASVEMLVVVSDESYVPAMIAALGG
jgi:hypothetical protein